VNNTNNLDDFFSFVSKAVIIIPIVVVIISLLLKFSSPKNPITNNFFAPTVIVIPTVKQEFKFDLKGPIVCDSLFIHDKKILFKNKSVNYLLNGDCFYNWETGKTNGERRCGLTNYINMAGNYLGFLNLNDLVNNNLIKDFIKDKNINLTSVVKSCKKEKIKDDSIFAIPKKIIFKS
jgi:hypothetical protein